ncbi:hypothetical protein [Streptomyces boninensis]|uniref:hypothetical protein n=1 Tax=Streptomyces boninensis TaxID=2039455 RepID=UPI003B21EFEE
MVEQSGGAGGAGNHDLAVGKDPIDRLTKGLRKVMQELKDAGGTETESLVGAGFSDMALTNMEAGDPGVAGAFEDFCERWEWGVRALVMAANNLANDLGLAAGLVWEEDRYRSTTFKYVVSAPLWGADPNMTEAEAGKQSWSDIFTPDAPDYSGESFDKAGQEAKDTWKDAAHQRLTEGLGGWQAEQMNDAMGVDQEAFEREVDERFGPDPEQQQPGGRQVEVVERGEG